MTTPTKYGNLAGAMELCAKTIVGEVGLPTSASEYLAEGAKAIKALEEQVAALRTRVADLEVEVEAEFYGAREAAEHAACD